VVFSSLSIAHVYKTLTLGQFNHIYGHLFTQPGVLDPQYLDHHTGDV